VQKVQRVLGDRALVLVDIQAHHNDGDDGRGAHHDLAQPEDKVRHADDDRALNVMVVVDDAEEAARRSTGSEPEDDAEDEHL
jgi:hypothetical protein